MDLVTLATLFGLGLGLIGIDAVTNIHTFSISLNVPSELEKRGFTQAVAEDIFINEVERIMEVPSFIVHPEVRSVAKESVVGAVAKSLQLEDVTIAIQRAIGLDPVHLNGAILPEEDGPRLYLTASAGSSRAYHLDHKGKKDDYVGLLHSGARLVMERAGPYRSALYNFVEDSKRDGDYTTAERIAKQELAREPRADTRERRAFMTNLLGMIALMRNDVPGGEARFREVIEMERRLAIGYLNLAFVQLHRGQNEEAIATARRVHEGRLTDAPQLLTAAAVMRGLASYSLGRHDEAAHRFHHALREDRHGSTIYEYWALMLQEMGRNEEAAIRRDQAVANRQVVDSYPEIAALYFYLDRNATTPLRRRPH